MISYLLLPPSKQIIIPPNCTTLFFCIFSLTVQNSINSFIHIIQIPTTTTHSHSNSVIQSKSKLEQHTTRQTFQLPFHAFAFGVTPEKNVYDTLLVVEITHSHHSPHSPRLASLVHFLLPPTLLLMSEAFFFSLSRYTQPRVVASPNGFFIFSSLSFLFFASPPFFANESLSISLSYVFPFPSSIKFDYNKPE